MLSGFAPLPCRWFPAAAVGHIPEAKFLDVILYSREQLVQEGEAMPGKVRLRLLDQKRSEDSAFCIAT